MICALKRVFDFTSLSFPYSDLDGVLKVSHCYTASTKTKTRLYTS